jgi:hypothetical protein
MAFPSSPTNGQIAVQNGITYTYASATNSWTRSPATLPSLSVYIDTFTGDGVTTAFTLSLTPGGADFISINIDGVSQLKSAYTLSTNIVTFTGTPDVGSVIEVKSWNAATVGVLTGLTFDSFTGNGSGTTYTLSTSPTNKNYTLVTVGGITQEKINYGVSGTTLTFTTAPPNTSPIEVMTFGPAINTAQAGGSNTQVQFNNNGTLAGTSLLTLDIANSSVVSTNASVTNTLIANIANITNINISNTSSQVPNAIVASTVYTNAQPNITSLGTLTSLTVSGVVSYGLSADLLLTKTNATGVVVHDLSTGAVFYHTTPSANFTANFTNVPTTDGRILMTTILVNQGATPYIPTAVQIDGVAQTIKWIAGITATGNASKIDVITFSLVRTGAAWTVLGQGTYFT